MKKSIVICALAALSAFSLSAQSADDIVKSSRDRIDAKTISSRSRMTIYAKDGSTTERLLDQYSADSDTGNRTMIIFQKPASVAGTRFLTVEKKGSTDDRWIFLPSLGKVRRISSAESSGSFMGTDFSYEDVSISDRDYKEDTHVLLREEALDGVPCWVIESTPKDSGFQYSKTVSWIGKGDYVARRIDLFDKRGEAFKRLEMGDIKSVQGKLTPMSMKMSNLQEKTATAVSVEIMKYDDKIPPSVFTTRFLETGRP